MKTLSCPKLGLWDKVSCPVFRDCCGGREQPLAKPNLDEWSVSSCAAAGSIWSPGVDRFHLSLVTEIHLAQGNHWGVCNACCQGNEFKHRKRGNLLLRQAWWKERKWRLLRHLKLFCQLNVFDERLSIVIAHYECLPGKLGQLFVSQERNLNAWTHTISVIVFN